jgi:hypothetical protein
MARAKLLTLSPSTVLGLFFLQRYRFLTITQFAHVSVVSRFGTRGVLS